MRIIITGAATGIGACVVQKLKARGDEVIALDIVEPQGVDQWIKVDMSDRASIDAAVAQLDGTFDGLISNAGLPPRDGLARLVLAVNFTGMVYAYEAILPLLHDGAAIVTTASRAGSMWRENIPQIKALIATDFDGLESYIANQAIDDVRAYNLSKEAAIVWSMGQTERLISKGLRINSVSPAAVNTGILSDFTAAFGDKVAKNIERVGRPGEPEEIADLITFLVSPQSGWLKGNDFVIDGGMSALATTDQLGI